MGREERRIREVLFFSLDGPVPRKHRTRLLCARFCILKYARVYPTSPWVSQITPFEERRFRLELHTRVRTVSRPPYCFSRSDPLFVVE
eukprot:scaffold73_cov118-Cylindrotheca_fusiformis.AAC.12